MSITTDEVVNLLGREAALEFAGSLLAEYGDRASEAVEALAAGAHTREPGIALTDEDPESPVYVADVWAQELRYHAIEERPVHGGSPGSFDIGTRCSGPVRWLHKTAMLPLRVAAKIGHPCGMCFDPDGSGE